MTGFEVDALGDCAASAIGSSIVAMARAMVIVFTASASLLGCSWIRGITAMSPCTAESCGAGNALGTAPYHFCTFFMDAPRPFVRRLCSRSELGLRLELSIRIMRSASILYPVPLSNASANVPSGGGGSVRPRLPRHVAELTPSDDPALECVNAFVDRLLDLP